MNDNGAILSLALALGLMALCLAGACVVHGVQEWRRHRRLTRPTRQGRPTSPTRPKNSLLKLLK